MHVKSRGKVHEPSQSARGIIAACAGAITETVLFLIVRGSEFQNPFQNIGRLYIGAAAMLATFTGVFKSPLAIPPAVPLFNAAIGFTSMTALVWATKHLPTYVYSLIAFIGLVASYMWGMIFADEVPNISAILGSAIVGLAVLQL
jgi:drug/metabolite transporter (DMT)-like permease